MKKTILITGVAGFIGRHLLRKLSGHSLTIFGIDLYYDNLFFEEFNGKINLMEGNLIDKEFIRKALNEIRPNYVIHLAGAKNRSNSINEFREVIEINYFGTLNIFESLLSLTNLESITILGTIEEYGQTMTPFKENVQEIPRSAYGLSKLSITKLALIFQAQFNLPINILRPSIAYGPGQGKDMFLPALINAMLEKKQFQMTEGNQLRDFLYIDDLIDGIILSMGNREIVGQIINLGSGQSLKIRDIAIKIAKKTNAIEFLGIGNLPYRKFEIMNYSVDIKKASEILNWHPRTNLSIGLEKTINFYKEYANSKA